MSENARPRFVLFKALIVLGLLLGLLLLRQTVVTYRFVASGMVRLEARREADRKVQALIKSSPLAGTRDAAALLPAIDEMVKEAPQQIAWVRILDMQARPLAVAGKAADAPSYSAGSLSRMLLDRDRAPEVRRTPAGQVLVAVNTIRIGPPPKNGEAGRPMSFGVIETGIYLDAVSTRFGSLRQNLVIGCAAAFALLAAVILIGLRFPHYMHGRQVEEQLAMARMVQFDLLPPGKLITRNVEFAARCVPAWQVGGDFYDAFETGDHQIALVLGDVSGKGLSAALLMGVVQGAVHASNGTGSPSSHEESVERLNHLLCMKTARERFVSLVWCYFDPVRSALDYVNAGHLPPLLIRRTKAGFEVQRLDDGGPVLGLLPGATYRQSQVPIFPGDLFVVFSDGILEAANALDEEFGEERILETIQENWTGSPTEICDAILARVRLFLGKEIAQDDQTLMVVRMQQVGAAVQHDSHQIFATTQNKPAMAPNAIASIRLANG